MFLQLVSKKKKPLDNENMHFYTLLHSIVYNRKFCCKNPALVMFHWLLCMDFYIPFFMQEHSKFNMHTLHPPETAFAAAFVPKLSNSTVLSFGTLKRGFNMQNMSQRKSAAATSPLDMPPIRCDVPHHMLRLHFSIMF